MEGMKNIDDGPDGLNEAAFERALGGGRKRKPVLRPVNAETITVGQIQSLRHAASDHAVTVACKRAVHSCTLCHGWIVVVADESDATSHFAIAAREEGAMPNRATDAYDERAFGLTGACRGSFGARPDCSPAINARAKAGR